MDYFSKFLRPSNHFASQSPIDRSQVFQKSWDAVKGTLQHPDERQLSKGIKSTDVPYHLKNLVDSLVWESTRTEEGGTGNCLEYLLKNDVLGTLVRLSETDRPSGIQAEVLRAVQNMVVLMDEQFLVHSVVHKAVLRLLRNCAGDDLQEQLDGRKVLGAAGSAVRSPVSEYEEDLVNLLCILCSRIRTYRELLMIFFHDKHWYHSESLFSGEEEEEEEDHGFTERRTPSPAPSQATVTSEPMPPSTRKPEYEFLLFNYLLRFVHREGHIGDFARAGLLFLMDVAMSPGEAQETPSSEPIRDAELALAEYILDGDFSDVLAAGLGAVYSLLPSKLVFLPSAPALNAGMVIGGSSPEQEREEQELAKERARALAIEDASDPEFKARLDHFLKLVDFLQDVLRKNMASEVVTAPALVGAAIGQSIMDAVRRVFLENILYPSVLECSDVDGSAVAVMSYIEVMIRTLRTGQLADLLVNFLVSEDNDEARPKQRTGSVGNLNTGGASRTPPLGSNKSRRRKSSAMILLEMEAPDSRKQTAYFTTLGRFTLRDMLVSNLRSNSQPTVTSALQLFQSVLIQHPHLTAERIMLVIADPMATTFPHPLMIDPGAIANANNPAVNDQNSFLYPEIQGSTLGATQFIQPETTYSTHEREVGLYLTLISRVDPTHSGDAFSTGYDNYLRDALFSIQNQVAYQLTDDELAHPELRRNQKHRLNVNDPILSAVLDNLRKFFINAPECNVALTGVLAALAIHPDRSLAGWLTFASNDTPHFESASREGTDANDEGDDRSIDFWVDAELEDETFALPASSMNETSRPVIHTVFHGLVNQLERYRALIENFDTFLLERRQGLLFSENMTDALTVTLDFMDKPAAITPALEVQQPPPKMKSSAANAFVAFLSPRKSKSRSSSKVAKKADTGETMPSPFGRHYQSTRSVFVEPFIAPLPFLGPWTSSRRGEGSTIEDVFNPPAWGEQQPQDPEEQQAESERTIPISLSSLLDNVVILEESIKELVAIIHARKSLGIDSVRYL